MSSYFRAYANEPLAKVKSLAEGFEAALPSPLRDGAKRARQLVTGLHGSGTLFEELGFEYVGPINGHDLNQLLPVLRAAHAKLQARSSCMPLKARIPQLKILR